jgi:hypothetical protein
MEQAAAGAIADGSLGRVELGEVPRHPAGLVPDQLVHRQRRRVEFQNLAKERPLLALVFVPGGEGALVPRALRVVVSVSAFRLIERWRPTRAVGSSDGGGLTPRLSAGPWAWLACIASPAAFPRSSGVT